MAWLTPQDPRGPAEQYNASFYGYPPRPRDTLDIKPTILDGTMRVSYTPRWDGTDRTDAAPINNGSGDESNDTCMIHALYTLKLYTDLRTSGLRTADAAELPGVRGGCRDQSSARPLNA